MVIVRLCSRATDGTSGERHVQAYGSKAPRSQLGGGFEEPPLSVAWRSFHGSLDLKAKVEANAKEWSITLVIA